MRTTSTAIRVRSVRSMPPGWEPDSTNRHKYEHNGNETKTNRNETQPRALAELPGATKHIPTTHPNEETFDLNCKIAVIG